MTRLILALALALLAGCAFLRPDCGHLTPGGPPWACVLVP